MLARYVPGTPEHRLALDSKTFAYMGDDASVDFTPARKRMAYEKP